VAGRAAVLNHALYLRCAGLGAAAELRDDVDIVTELVFADAGAYQAWVAVMYAPGSGVADDEAKFLDRSKTRSYTVIERTS
jgi:hypothetical protein